MRIYFGMNVCTACEKKKNRQVHVINNDGNKQYRFSRMIFIYFGLHSLGHLVKKLVPEQN